MKRLTALVLTMTVLSVSAQADVVYRSIVDTHFREWLTHFQVGGLDRRLQGGTLAQQIRLGNHDTVTSISFPIVLFDGELEDQVSVELWSDAGLGMPDQHLQTLEMSVDLDNDRLESVGTVTGLMPNQPYYVVVGALVDRPSIDFTGIGDAVNPTLFANGAGRLLTNEPSLVEDEWVLASEVLPRFGPPPEDVYPFSINDYLVMQVEAERQANSVRVLPPDVVVDGLSQAEWGVRETKWAFSFPSEINPLLDQTGEFSHLGSQGPVFYLDSVLGSGDVTRTATIRDDQHIFINLTQFFVSPEPEDTESALRSIATEAVDAVDTLTLQIDGVDADVNLFDHRQPSPPGFYNVMLPENNVLDVPAGTYPVLHDSYKVMLDRLEVGQYTITFGGVARDDDGNVLSDLRATYEIAVISSPSGDFDGDDMFTVSDVNRLLDAIGSDDPGFDLTGDLKVDRADIRDLITSPDKMNTYIGDANLDGEFNSADLVAVFTAGEYEDKVPMNSSWGTGDWNGDANFDSSDIIFAFQDGGYEQGPRIGANAVPEPRSLLPLITGLVGLSTALRSRRRRI